MLKINIQVIYIPLQFFYLFISKILISIKGETKKNEANNQILI
jgi:hypothetical protein